MERKLVFVKLAGRWFVHLSDYPGLPDDLEMVMGADTLCERIDTKKTGFITVRVSDKSLDGEELILNFIENTDDPGAWYKLKNFDLNIWLCNVTKYIFGEFPKTIYIKLDDTNK